MVDGAAHPKMTRPNWFLNDFGLSANGDVWRFKGCQHIAGKIERASGVLGGGCNSRHQVQPRPSQIANEKVLVERFAFDFSTSDTCARDRIEFKGSHVKAGLLVQVLIKTASGEVARGHAFVQTLTQIHLNATAALKDEGAFSVVYRMPAERHPKHTFDRTRCNTGGFAR
jgi:hypothetical protein